MKSISVSAAALREAFDGSFAVPRRQTHSTAENFLAIRVGGDAFLLRAAEISGLHADKRIVPLPSPLSPLLGAASFRGQIVPVYDLGALLGYARGGYRWLVVARHDVVAFAFEAFESHLLLAAERIQPGAGDCGKQRPREQASANLGAPARPVLHLGPVIEEIHERARSVRQSLEKAT